MSRPTFACLLALGASLSLGCAAGGSRQPKLLGSVSGKSYTSPTARFTVELPVMTNPFVTAPLVFDESRAGALAFEQVAFAVPDVGELYLVGDREISPEIVAAMNRNAPRDVLAQMVEQTMIDWRPFPAEPTNVRDSFVATHLGDALVRVYLAPKGSLLMSAQNRRPTAEDTFDTLIAILCVRFGDRHLFAIAEFDAAMNGLTGLHAPADNEKIAARLTDQVLRIFGTMQPRP